MRVRGANGHLLARIPRAPNRLYVLDITTARSECLSAQGVHDAWRWNACLGHLNFPALQKLAREGWVRGMPDIKQPGQPCEGCLVGKQRRSSFPTQGQMRTSRSLELVHRDLCGPITPATPSGKKFFLLMVDDYSRQRINSSGVISPSVGCRLGCCSSPPEAPGDASRSKSCHTFSTVLALSVRGRVSDPCLRSPPSAPRPKAATATQAAHLEGCILPRAAVKATSSALAGRRRSTATKKGPVLAMTLFMATMAVPQKKDNTSDAHSHHSLASSASAEPLSSSSSLSETCDRRALDVGARADAVDRVRLGGRRPTADGFLAARARAWAVVDVALYISAGADAVDGVRRGRRRLAARGGRELW
ncbi:hypothetical protein E2562_032429 [Oryza meyeriana var. granulata]|uniref:GAG-pre-integrase domain-containing protein n=1 Tax=Oryza meyeriana var. granulata TaxID=110450 RepID=A0A6G1E5N5_9ORYZ|nr:hypothetical protein E2562_032429 [Oryza meyeriana var. granulata]